MGDHRASIKIEFSMYGETKKADMWINWSPDDYPGVDRRVIEFFEEAANQCRSNITRFKNGQTEGNNRKLKQKPNAKNTNG